MSRYLKADPGAVYKFKKVYTASGGTTLSIPGTSPTIKAMVFGGGGNACAGYVYDPGCCCFCCGCLCYACIMHNSGSGGGFTEKLYAGVAGLTACVVVGAAEGTSSFCVPALGTITATGGTSTCLNASPGSLPRCTAFGVGSCGDVNKCGSLGACRITSFLCNCCNGGCLFSTGFVAVPGGAPGNTAANGVAPTMKATTTTCCIFCCRQSNPSPYGSPTCNCFNAQVCVFSDLPRGYGGCPIETDKFYAYDWDVVGGGKCETAGSQTASSLTSTTTCACSFSCNVMTGCTFIATIAVPAAYVTGNSGNLTGSGGAGGTGGVGGGGGGIFTNCATVRCISDINCVAGGSGLVVVYY